MRAREELSTLYAEKFEVEKLVDTLKVECFSLKHWISLYQDDMRIENEVVGELSGSLDEFKLKEKGKEKEMEDQRMQYVELYDESIRMISRCSRFKRIYFVSSAR